MIVSEKKYIINSIFSLIVVSFISLSVLCIARIIIIKNSTIDSVVNIGVSPSGLCPDIDNDEHYFEKSRIDSEISRARTSEGISNDFKRFFPRVNEYACCVIEKNGIVSVWEKGIGMEDNKKYARHLGWWGPDGFSTESATGLGNFSSDIEVVYVPIVQRLEKNTENDRIESKYYLFDNISKCLYMLKLTNKIQNGDRTNTITSEVTVGPKNPDIGQILQIADSIGNIYGENVYFSPVTKIFVPKKTELIGVNGQRMIELNQEQDSNASKEQTGFIVVGGLLFAIDNKGNIYQLNEKSLTFGDIMGKLPSEPNKMHKYFADPIARLTKDSAGLFDCQHFGIAVSTININGTVSLEIFDANGKNVGQNIKSIFPAKGTTLGWYDLCMTPAEACYGLFFHFLSYLMPDSMQFMPYSYAARSVLVEDYDYESLMSVLLLCLVDYAICIYLLRRSFKRSGLPGGYFKYWAVLIVILGPMALIAYLLTRPGIKQVTCPNCGQNRRPDQEKCLNCKAPWELPHLEPVGWKIVGQRSCQSARLPEKLAKPFDSVET